VDARLVFSLEPITRQDTPAYRLMRALEQDHGALVVELPPLRERPEDIAGLADHIVAEYRNETGAGPLGIDPALADMLARHDWPGNLRELRDTLRRACAHAKPGETLAFRHLPHAVREALPPAPGELRIPPDTPLREIERLAIEEAMKTHGGQKEAVAKTLGIGLRTLYRKLEQYERE
jgi:transcriptional regulator with PAS, ATPase and Fis domain